MKSTPHINPTAEIAETVLMPGDPLRAKFISENFLSNAKQFNSVRNMFGYTGMYNNKSISVMGSGMGIPSMGIYSYELFNFYGVKNIIRIGTCGSLHENIKIHDIILGMGSCTDSNYPRQFKTPGNISAIASWDLLLKAYQTSQELNIKTHVGNILATDVFYRDNQEMQNWIKLGILAVEMESTALYLNAAISNTNALCILTVSDNLITHEATSAQERQESFKNMMRLALETAVKISN